ncbi:hypothetical protein [Paracoccus xiamenensis]|nr:hypothetical protein [Paracoccus xiamenensis]NHF72762.1 hypothetical protein [Paracoccus xiamenensis]
MSFCIFPVLSRSASHMLAENIRATSALRLAERIAGAISQTGGTEAAH